MSLQPCEVNSELAGCSCETGTEPRTKKISQKHAYKGSKLETGTGRTCVKWNWYRAASQFQTGLRVQGKQILMRCFLCDLPKIEPHQVYPWGILNRRCQVRQAQGPRLVGSPLCSYTPVTRPTWKHYQTATPLRGCRPPDLPEGAVEEVLHQGGWREERAPCVGKAGPQRVAVSRSGGPARSGMPTLWCMWVVRKLFFGKENTCGTV